MLLALAPMQDVTDIAFMRTLLRIKSLPDYFVTPYFRSTPTTCAYAEVNLKCIEENETGKPIWAQLAGSDPDALLRDCEQLLNYPIAGIDLNAGCPSPLVNRNLAGAGLLRDLPRFDSILHAMRSFIPAGKFSVKCRLGWADAATEFPIILDIITTAQPDLVTIHGRTKKQGYSGLAALPPVAQAVQQLAPCPVIGNGDILSPDDANRWMQQVAPAGLMIGRGAVRNPYIFRQLKGGPAPDVDEMKHYYQVLIEETEKIIYSRHEGRLEQVHCNRMKKYLAYIYPNLAPECEYHLRRCQSIAEMQRLLFVTQ
ncbi:MAG: tRNA-dihydrouridine synthase [Akkermansia sp.]